jgi:ABC-2 type transport system permease protein
MTAVSLALGLPLLADQPGPDLAAGDVTAVTSANLAAGLLFVIMGVALGTLMRNQVAGVVVLLMLNFFLNPLVSMADEAAGNLTPFGAAQVLTGMTHDTTLSSGAAALVLAAWTAPLLAVAIASDRRRDLA